MWRKDVFGKKKKRGAQGFESRQCIEVFYKAHWLPPKGHCIYVALLIRCECLNGHGSFSQERFWYSSNRVNLFSG